MPQPPKNITETVLVEESSDIWINIHDSTHFLSDGSERFVWASERTGMRHLYLIKAGGGDGTPSCTYATVLTASQHDLGGGLRLGDDSLAMSVRLPAGW